MEYLRTKVAIAAILGAVCSFVSAETIETCTEIKDPTTRLACYDNASTIDGCYSEVELEVPSPSEGLEGLGK